MKVKIKEKVSIEPKISPMGFEDINFKNVDHNHQLILNYLVNYSKNNSFKYINLSSTNKEIIQKLISSYQKTINGKNLLEDEYILKGHELFEFDKLEEKNYLRYLIYRYKYNIFPKLHIVDKYPPHLQIELSSICNFRCVMCYQSDKSFSSKSFGHMDMMKYEVFTKIIDEIQDEVEAVTFASRGEPTLHQDFSKILKYINNKFLAFKLNTNASMLNEKMIHDILSSNMQTLVFSIDSFEKEQYEKIRVNGNFDKIFRNLELFTNIKQKEYPNSKLITRVSGVKIKDDQSIDDMKKTWSNYVDAVAFVPYTPWESSYDNPINNLSHACHELWTRLFVWADGRANPCDYDYKSTLSKWNVKFLNVQEIWNSREYEKLRNYHLNKKRNLLSPCNKCLA